MLKRLYLILIASFVTIGVANAQTSKKITGVVTDGENGEPLIGVAIAEPNTANGTVTDLDGNYSITINGDKLTFSYIGYQNIEKTISQSGTIDVKMGSNTQLDEVVVVGYGTQKKSDLTGSVASISVKILKIMLLQTYLNF